MLKYSGTNSATPQRDPPRPQATRLRSTQLLKRNKSTPPKQSEQNEATEKPELPDPKAYATRRPRRRRRARWRALRGCNPEWRWRSVGSDRGERCAMRWRFRGEGSAQLLLHRAAPWRSTQDRHYLKIL